MGLKKGVGFRDAFYPLQSVVDFYMCKGSTVNLCLLDMSKAFHKVNHCGLYIKLMKRNLPRIYLRILINWYSKCCDNVTWDNVLSRCFSMVYGVRQRGALSPVLFVVYVDDIIERLNDSKLGCFIGDLYLGCIMYADDLILISVSVSIMQQMIFICEKEAKYIDMKFNTYYGNSNW